MLDSRGELGAFGLGPLADVLKNCPKAAGFEMAVRSLSPEIILCDELAPGDIEAVKNAARAGVGLVATLHSGADPRVLYPTASDTSADSTRTRRQPTEARKGG